MISSVAVAASNDNRSTPSRREAPIAYSTLSIAYVSIGSEAGVRLGSDAEVLRRGSVVGRCRIVQVADNQAACLSAGGAKGDAIRLMVQPEARPWSEKKPLAYDPAQSERILTALSAVQIPKVKYQAVESKLLLNNANQLQTEVGYTGWFPTVSSDDSFQQERIDLYAVSGAFGNSGFRSQVDTSLQFWSQRPDVIRYRANTDLQFFLREADISNREAAKPLLLSVGRLRPWHVPGVNMLDGVQVGWRASGRESEFGVYGGLLPDFISLEPDTEQVIGGVYGYQQLFNNATGTLRHEFRLGVLNSAQLPSMLQVESLLSGEMGRWLMSSVNTRATLWDEQDGSLRLSAFNFDLTSRPTDKFDVNFDFRFLDDSLPEWSDATGEGSIHAGGSTVVRVTKWLHLAVLAGHAESVDSVVASSATDRNYLGGEVRFVNLSNSVNNLTVGYQEESGWIDGRSAYLQPTIRLWRRNSIVTRVGYSQNATAIETTEEWMGLITLRTPVFTAFDLNSFLQTIVNDETSAVSGGLRIARAF